MPRLVPDAYRQGVCLWCVPTTRLSQPFCARWEFQNLCLKRNSFYLYTLYCKAILRRRKRANKEPCSCNILCTKTRRNLVFGYCKGGDWKWCWGTWPYSSWHSKQIWTYDALWSARLLSTSHHKKSILPWCCRRTTLVYSWQHGCTGAKQKRCR